ncbi:hypothetical protein OG824_13540 [Streptomyces prunicolor]|uniref:hypothetical protein n=1 Tax=Streptomyces prunicolor TaxID=67348 RepID=UPI0022536362|nr:hypothetical protein [Streptomyces prunicolor]MCX5236223.1 hypothetical protein [Streptomyces prunicolor]
MKIAGEGWGNVDVWSIVVTAVVSLLVGLLGAWAALRAGNPKRRLHWWVESNTPLMSPQYGSSGDISIRYQGSRVDQPRIVEFVVANTGRKDITSSMFHADDSLIFDFGERIVRLLTTNSSPDGSTTPPITYPGTTRVVAFELNPCHIAERQVVRFTFLIDGDEAEVRCSQMPLVDVRVVNEVPGARRRSLVLGALNVLPGIAGIPLPVFRRR